MFPYIEEASECVAWGGCGTHSVGTGCGAHATDCGARAIGTAAPALKNWIELALDLLSTPNVIWMCQC